MNQVISRRKYAGCYDVEVFGLALCVEEVAQSCCGKSEAPLWMIYYDGVYDLGEFESKRNAMYFLSIVSEEELNRRINER